jgi:hypothetical protein
MIESKKHLKENNQTQSKLTSHEEASTDSAQANLLRTKKKLENKRYSLGDSELTDEIP